LRQAAEPVPVAQLVAEVDIPYQGFTLANGLRVLVHTDRKAPIVAVSTWYDVGSKHEPEGKTGFAHLFEHLMFQGSENAPGDFFAPLREVGATDFNGTTNFDRTNYFETVPKPALERALFLESDRMGWLLGAIDQGLLDEQRGVVQNEKRQGDNQPYGLVFYKLLEELLAGTPYWPQRDRLDGRPRRRQPRRRQELVPQHYGPNNTGAGARRRHRRRRGAPAGREVLRRNRRRSADRSRPRSRSRRWPRRRRSPCTTASPPRW
jgi:hypothetical protein